MNKEKEENPLREIDWEKTGAKPKQLTPANKIFLNDFRVSDDDELSVCDNRVQEKTIREEVRTLVDGVGTERLVQTAIKARIQDYEFPKKNSENVISPKNSEEGCRQGDDPVAATQGENRPFLSVNLNGQLFRALYDTGSQISLIGRKGAELFKKRLKGSSSLVSPAMGGSMAKPLGVLDVVMEVDGKMGKLQFKAVDSLSYDMILGIDFMETWNTETKDGNKFWKIAGGEWNEFSEPNKAKTKLIAECAGICELTSDQEECVQALIRKYLEKCTESNYGRYPNPVRSLRRGVEQRDALLSLDPEMWKDRIKRLDALRDLVGKHIEIARDKQASAYYSGRRDVKFKVGD